MLTKIERHLTDWEKIFTHHTTDTALISKIKYLENFSNKTPKNLIKKRWQVEQTLPKKEDIQMANRYLKKLPWSLIREMHIHSTMRYQPTLILAHIRKSRNNQSLWRCGEIGFCLSLIRHCWEGCLAHSCVENRWRLSKRLRRELPFDPAILLLGIYLKVSRTHRTPLFIMALIAKICKQLKCQRTDEWIKKLIHLHTGIVLSYKKRWNAVHC